MIYVKYWAIHSWCRLQQARLLRLSFRIMTGSYAREDPENVSTAWHSERYG
jgi:hypothetical protein